MLLFYDTETTGFPNGKKPADDIAQPHCVQLAAILATAEGEVRSEISLILNPGVPIPHKVSEIHGINNLIAEESGVSPKLAAAMFNGLCQRATTLIAHNISFDNKIMSILFMREHKSKFPTGKMEMVDTMKLSTPIVNLPPTEAMVRYGKLFPKSAKLSEAYQFFFKEELLGAHDALVDVRACMRIYFHMKEKGMLK